jgi:predicted nucleotidyltransferase
MTAPTESRLPPQAEEILHSLRATLPELRRRSGVTDLGLFGPYARGERKQRSDLDLLVVRDRCPEIPYLEVSLARMLAELP